MMAIGKLIGVGVEPKEFLAVGVSPSLVRYRGGNGGGKTSQARAAVSGGIGPFTYEWEIIQEVRGTITVNNPTSESTTFSSNGFDTFIGGGARVTVTDTGDGNKTASATVNIGFEFGGIDR